MAYKVAVIVGGGPNEREFSIKSGAHISASLQSAGHKVIVLDCTPELIPSLCEEKPDCAYIAIPGKQGESGQVQAVLEFVGIPYIGTPSAKCETTWNKFHMEDTMGVGHNAKGDFSTAVWPKGFCISRRVFDDLGAQSALNIIENNITWGYPVVVKPAHGVGAQGVYKVESTEQLFPAIVNVFTLDESVVVQEWVSGVEMAVTVLGSGDGAVALPPVEIVPKRGWYDRQSRFDNSLVDYYAPVRSTSLAPDPGMAYTIRSEIESAAVEVYRAYGLRDMARIDLIWNGRQICLLEINVAPNVTDTSMLPAACHAAGYTFPAVLDRLVTAAVERGGSTGSSV